MDQGKILESKGWMLVRFTPFIFHLWELAVVSGVPGKSGHSGSGNEILSADSSQVNAL